MHIKFSWSASKAASNIRKHGVSFSSATKCFYDEHALIIPDFLHSLEEERFVLIGQASPAEFLVVIHAYWELEEVIRIISARNATKNEINKYLEGVR